MNTEGYKSNLNHGGSANGDINGRAAKEQSSIQARGSTNSAMNRCLYAQPRQIGAQRPHYVAVSAPLFVMHAVRYK